MKQRTAPTLPPNARRREVLAWRDQMKTYARKEFGRGATPHDVLGTVPEASALPALRHLVDSEYLDYLGVPRRNVHYAAVLLSMVCYFAMAGFANSSNPVIHFALPGLVAIALAVATEKVLNGFLRSRRERAVQR